MEMYLELYASLMHLLPPGKDRHRRKITVDEGAVVQAVINTYKIPPDMAHIVLVNGKFVCAMPVSVRSVVQLRRL